MKFVIVTLILGSFALAHAQTETGGSDVGSNQLFTQANSTQPVYKATAAEKKELQQSILSQDSSIKKAACRSAIHVSTGGHMGYAIGAVCNLDGKIEISCKNMMTGSTASVAVQIATEISTLTEEYQMLTLIADQCTGG